MTRTVAVGKNQINSKAIVYVDSGSPTSCSDFYRQVWLGISEVDRAAREVIESWHGEYRLGHGIGMMSTNSSIMEGTTWSSKKACVSVEPGISPVVFGIEDCGVVTKMALTSLQAPAKTCLFD